MDDFDKYLKEQMADPEFKKEWDNSELEYKLMMISNFQIKLAD